MTDLTDKLAGAKAGSRGLDAELHRLTHPELSDTFIETGWLVGGNHAQPQMAPPYTTSLDAIVTLIGEKLPGWGWSISSDGEASLDPPNDGLHFAEGATPALALCIALLHALKDSDHDR